MHPPERWLEGSTPERETELKIEYEVTENRKTEKLKQNTELKRKTEKQQKNESKNIIKNRKDQNENNLSGTDESRAKDSENIMPNQSKYQPEFHGRMQPDPCINHHPAFDMLFKYATEGCLVDCGESWS